MEDCFSCKVISICCLFGIGTYLIFEGRRQPQKYKNSFTLLGLGCIGLGVGEIFDKSPFRMHKEIDP
ncbi:hypothetical protein BDFB_003082 [Asbolus verrucosus]|uniref:Uncharacterized protein n=1 Tax=Asbolus verrucosus TaxID=1661398 RepID=A0A482W6U7_ASBVE|nr:hypothetical protein BDFB_003082 [Asbolus verrucosus]